MNGEAGGAGGGDGWASEGADQALGLARCKGERAARVGGSVLGQEGGQSGLQSVVEVWRARPALGPPTHQPWWRDGPSPVVLNSCM